MVPPEIYTDNGRIYGPINTYLRLPAAYNNFLHWNGRCCYTRILRLASHYTRALKGAAIVARLMNDIVSHKFEQKRGHVSSAVECYMKEFGVTEEEASIGLCRQASDAWKAINESLLLPNAVSRPVLTRIHCFTYAIDVVYEYGDGYTAPDDTLKNLIASTLIEQVPL